LVSIAILEPMDTDLRLSKLMMHWGLSCEILTVFGTLMISRTRSSNQLMSTTRGSLYAFLGTVCRERRAARLSHCTPRILATFCHGLWCMRLSGLMMADVTTASTNDRTQGRSLGLQLGKPRSKLRRRAISKARRQRSILDWRCRMPSLGATNFEISHLRRIL